jgi:hypothetical protein
MAQCEISPPCSANLDCGFGHGEGWRRVCRLDKPLDVGQPPPGQKITVAKVTY